MCVCVCVFVCVCVCVRLRDRLYVFFTRSSSMKHIDSSYF